MKVLNSLFAVLCVLIWSQVAVAGDGPLMDNPFKMMNMKNLDLTKEQRAQIKELRQKNKDVVEKLQSEMKTAKKAFKDAIASGKSKDEVQKAFESMLDKKNTLARTRMDALLSAREVLTAEQKAKLFSGEKQDKKSVEESPEN